MARTQDMIGGASNTQGTISGKTKGSRGIASQIGGVAGAPQTKRKALSNVGWPGEQDSTPQNKDRTQSAD